MKIAIASLCVAAVATAQWQGGWSQPQQSSGWSGGWSQPQSSGWSGGWSQPSGWNGGYNGWNGGQGYPHPHPHPHPHPEEEEEVPPGEGDEMEGHGWDFHKYNGHIPHYHDFSYEAHDDLDWQLEDNAALIAQLQADCDEREAEI